MLGLTSQEIQENFSEFISTFYDIYEFIHDNDKNSSSHQVLSQLKDQINKLEYIFDSALEVYKAKEKQELEEDEEYFG
jgi:hypothetical protein